MADGLVETLGKRVGPRFAAAVALLFNVMMVIIAIIAMTVQTMVPEHIQISLTGW